MNALRAAVACVTRFEWGDGGDVDERQVMPLLPLVGAGVGLGLAAVAAVSVWLAGRGAGTLLGSVLVFGLWWWLTGGRGFREVIAVTERVVPAAESDLAALYGRITLFQAFLLLRIVCIGILVYLGQALWLVAVCTLSAAAAADLLRPSAAPPSEQEDSDWRGAYAHWVVAAVAALLAAGFCDAFVAGAFGLVIAWLLPATLDRVFLRSGTRAPLPHGGAAIAEGLLLLLGVIFFMAF